MFWIPLEMWMDSIILISRGTFSTNFEHTHTFVAVCSKMSVGKRQQLIWEWPLRYHTFYLQIRSACTNTHTTHTHTHALHTPPHPHTHTTHHTHTHVCFSWKVRTSHRCNVFYTLQTVCAICPTRTLHLNLALIGDCAFLPPPQKINK